MSKTTVIYEHVKCFFKYSIAGFLMILIPFCSTAESYSANFQNTEIREFVNTVSKVLNKTIVIDPAIQGTINVRSYDSLDSERYYQFFLSVLQVYGFTAVNMPGGITKIIPERNAKSAGIPLVQDGDITRHDEVIMRIVPLDNISGRELAPLLRQLNDAAEGSVVHYDAANMLLMTGRASVVERLVAIVARVDNRAQHHVETLALHNASASDVVNMANALHRDGTAGQPGTVGRIYASIVADERTNTVLVSGDAPARARMIQTLQKLDREHSPGAMGGNTQVVYLKYAKAAQLIDVLNGVINNAVDSSDPAAPVVIETSKSTPVSVTADDQTNSLILNAPNHIMRQLRDVIDQLDIRRPQVLVEAIIAEVSDAQGLNFGIQWMNNSAGGTNFGSATDPSVTAIPGNGMGQVLGSAQGLAAGFYRGNWAGLLTALQTSNQNNILATPSIVTLDNVEAEFTVGQDVPVLTGSQTTSGDNVYNTVERRSVGIKLKVTPQINLGDTVRLDIEQEVSSVSTSAASNTLGPTFDTRNVRNAVLVGTGNTVVVGGLLDNSTSEGNSAVPLLGRIPVLKHLFGTTSKSTSKRNLMLFIRPTIMREQDRYDQVSLQSLSRFKQHDFSTPADQVFHQALDQSVGAGGQTVDAMLNDIQRFYAGSSNE